MLKETSKRLGYHINKGEYCSTGLNRSSGEALIGKELTHKPGARTSLKERAIFLPNMTEIGAIDETTIYTLNATNAAETSETRTAKLHVTGSIEPEPAKVVEVRVTLKEHWYRICSQFRRTRGM